jgi:Domain of Unknown Function (DUF928)
MIHRKIGIRPLILTAVTLILTFPQLLMTLETISANSKKQQLSWQRVLGSIFRRNIQRPTSRPVKNGDLCFIAPANQKPIYSNRPLFLWKGNFKKIAVANLNNDNPFWETNISAQKSFVIYTAKDELQPGKTYEWHGYLESPVLLARFQVMDAQQRQVVSDELKALEKQLQAKNANKQTIALERAKYFADKELWSDALQEAYSVSNPSAELSQILRDLPNQLCK